MSRVHIVVDISAIADSALSNEAIELLVEHHIRKIGLNGLIRYSIQARVSEDRDMDILAMEKYVHEARKTRAFQATSTIDTHQDPRSS